MIKFFRHIRQRLLSEGKTGKPALPAVRYIKYAIGEIFLVVIGILIAVQVNNWNVNRNINIALNQSLEKLLVELNQDIRELNLELDQNAEIMTALDSCLIILIEPKNYSNDKFDSLFKNINYTITFEFARVTFDELSSSGKLKQLVNTKLSDSLIKYYGDVRYKSVEEALVHHVRDNIRTYTLTFDYLNFDDDLDTYSSSDFNIKKKMLDEYSSDVRIINAIRFKIFLHRLIDQNYRNIKLSTEYLIKAIEQELEN